MKSIITVLFAFILSQNVNAQIQVSSFSPANGTTSVNTTTDVVITFNQAIAQWESPEDLFETVIPFPLDSISITNASLSVDKLSITFSVVQKANTDYTWVILGIKGESNDLIDKPYTFSYTTKSAFSTNSISGSLYERALVGGIFKSTVATPKKLSLGQFGWFNSQTSTTYLKSQDAEITELDYSFGIVMLTTSAPNLFQEDGGANEETPSDSSSNEGDGPPPGIKYVSTVSSTGEFTLPNIENGNYFLVSYLFKQEVDEFDGSTSIEPYAIGFYDEAEDFEADTIKVENTSFTNLQIGLFNFDSSFNGYSLENIFDSTIAQIDAEFGTNKLLYIRGIDSNYNQDDEDDGSVNKNQSNFINEMIAPSGLSSVWGFGIYVPDSAKVYNVVQTPIGMLYFDDETEGLNSAMFDGIAKLTNLPMGSIEAVQLTETNGGSTFRTTVPDSAEADVEFFFVSNADIFSDKPDEITGTVWVINYHYNSYSSETNEYSEDEFSVIINALTKEVLFSGKMETAVEDDKKLVDIYKLNQNYPNPFNPSTTIAFSIPKASNVTVQIYNSLGQLVSTLVNQTLSSGNHSYVFDASALSSGVYFYNIKADGFSQTKKMSLIK